MSPSFLVVLMLMLLALTSPLAAAGVVWALCVKRRRQTGVFAGTVGIASSVSLIAAHFALAAVQDEGPISNSAIGIAGGAGFTLGVLASCAWTRIGAGKSKPARAVLAGVLMLPVLAWLGAQRWNSAAPDDVYAATPVYSPDKQYMAVLFTQSGGGAISPYCFSKVSVSPASVLPSDAYARKFHVYEGSCHSLGFKYRPNRPPVLESAPILEWRGPRELNITFDPKQAPLGIKKFLFVDHADDGRVKIVQQHFQR
jgi:hypothetical protein